MPMMNARCDTCGTVFPSGIYIENSTDITFSGNRSGPCPRCGGMGSLIANNTTIDVIGDRVTVKRGWISPENLAVVASSFERFRTAQDNRPQVEAQIADTFPQLRSKVQTMSNERLLLLISMLLALMATWQNNPPSMDTAVQQVEQTMRAVQESTSQTLAEAFAAYEGGKESAHALRKKIARYFPATEVELRTAGFGALGALATLIVGLLTIWETRRQARFNNEQFEATQEQSAQILHYLKRLTAAAESNSLESTRDQILREIKDQDAD